MLCLCAAAAAAVVALALPLDSRANLLILPKGREEKTSEEIYLHSLTDSQTLGGRDTPEARLDRYITCVTDHETIDILQQSHLKEVEEIEQAKAAAGKSEQLRRNR